MDEEHNQITDKSGDKSFFNVTPQLVWALSRSPYDYALWNVIKMVAGDASECFLSTPDLATLSMMSEGKVTDCRAYLIHAGLLTGEVRRDPGQLPVWHLRVPDLWQRNADWRAETGHNLKDRVAMKREQQETLAGKKVCSRCKQMFKPSGRRSHRCKTCQTEVERERSRIYQSHTGLREKLLIEVGKCQRCGRDDLFLEMHHIDGVDANTTAVELLCWKCHDAAHSSDESKGHSSDEQPHSSDESVTTSDESVTTSDETKNIHEGEPEGEPKKNHPPADAAEITGSALLDQFLGPRQPRPSTTPTGKNSAVPVQAGGADSPAEAIVDGVCKFNGLAGGITALPEKKRTSWVRRAAEIVAQWGGATEEQARLSWQAWTVNYGWREKVNPFYTSFPEELGPLLLGVKEGSITIESLQALENGGNGNGGHNGNGHHPTGQDLVDYTPERGAELCERLARHRQRAG